MKDSTPAPFYASTGVVLNNISRDGNKLKLAVRAEEGVTYKAEWVSDDERRGSDQQAAIDER